jgi:hypothetical protein
MSEETQGIKALGTPGIKALGTPGHYILETRKGYNVTPRAQEKLTVLLSDVPEIVAAREFTPKESICIIGDTGIKVQLNLECTPITFETIIIGTLTESAEIKAMRINGDGWDAKQLARFVRFNAHLWQSPIDAQNLVNALSRLLVDRQTKKEQEQDTRGNAKASKSVTTITNLPENTIVEIPLFNGTSKVTLTISFDLNPDNDAIHLVCPDLNYLVQEYRNREVQRVVGHLREHKIPCANQG